jgi:hypothetical protein
MARGVEETDLGAPDFIRAIKAEEIVVLRATAAAAPGPSPEVAPAESSAGDRSSRSSGGSRRRSS